MFALQRYFVAEANWNNDQVHITNDDANHIIRVMRFQIDDQIICNHTNGQAALCRITAINQDYVVANVEEWLEENVELPIAVTIAQGLPKGDKMDMIFQKGTELGASSFIPFEAERSIVKWDKKKMEKKLIRFAKIVKEASEQSHRNKVPVIHPKMNITELIQVSKQYNVKVFAYEEEAKTSQFKSFSNVLTKLKLHDQMLICVGPEGGFTRAEADELIKNGFISVRLGPRILRTETAALYALACISYQIEELGCL